MSATFLVDLEQKASGGVSVVPQTIASATTTNGTHVDCRDLDGTVTMHVVTGNCEGATLVLNAKLQEAIEDPAVPGSPLASDWSDVFAGAMPQLSGATAADNKQVFTTSQYRTKRFVRGVVITAGTTPSVPIAVSVIGQKKISGVGTGFKS